MISDLVKKRLGDMKIDLDNISLVGLHAEIERSIKIACIERKAT
jgi:hypothetical protein